MSETIVLHNDHPEVVRGIVKDSSVLCSDTSAPDVFIHVITASDTAELFKGDGTVIPKMTRTRVSRVSQEPGRRSVLGDRCRHGSPRQRD